MIRRVLLNARIWTKYTEPFEGYVFGELPIYQDEMDGSVFGFVKGTLDEVFEELLDRKKRFKLRQSDSSAPVLDNEEAVMAWLNSTAVINISSATVVAWSIVDGRDQFIREPSDTDEFVAAVENERKS